MINYIKTVGAGIVVLAFTITALIIPGCSVLKKENKSVRSIRLNFSMPAIDAQGMVYQLTDTLYLYYYKNLVMYMVPKEFYYSTVLFNKEGDIIKDELDSMRIKNQYFIYTPGNNTGIMYDSLNARAQQFKVDSFINIKWFNTLKKLYERKKPYDSLLSVSLKGDQLVETYMMKRKVDASFYDSSYYYFRKGLNDVDFSFAPTDEREMKMKLCKMEIVYNANPNTSDRYLKLPKRFVFEMADNPVNDIQNIMELFRRFQQGAPGG